MLDSPKDERSEKDQKHKKQLEEMNNDLLALLRSMDHLGVKLFMLKTECSGSSRFENQQEDQYDDQVDEGVRAKHFMFWRNKRILVERGDEFWKERWLLVICQPFIIEY